MVKNIVILLLGLLCGFASLHAQKNKHPKRLKYFSIGANASMQMPIFANLKDDGGWRNSKGYGNSLFDYGGGLSLMLSNAKGWGIGCAYDYRRYSTETDKFDYRAPAPNPTNPGPIQTFFYFESTPPGISYKYDLYEYHSYSLFASYVLKRSAKLSFVFEGGPTLRFVKGIKRVFEYYPTSIRTSYSDIYNQDSALFFAVSSGVSYSFTQRLALHGKLNYTHSPFDFQRRNRHTGHFIGMQLSLVYQIRFKK